MPRYQAPRHLRLLDGLLYAAESGRISGLIVTMPPRHGKSMLISQFFPAWYLLWNPDRRVILLSYNASFAKTWGRKARDVVIAWGPTFGLSVRDDSRAADHWNIQDHSGGMDTTGVGGSLTGRGANLFIVDDLFKDHRQALSQVHRTSAWELYQSCVETRAEPGAAYVIVGTRWHEDDVIGRIIRQIKSEQRPGWKIISLPALAEEGDPIGRESGEALWPERYPREYLEAHRSRWDHDEARLGPYWWSALYQQRPTPREGGLFRRKWFKYFTHDDEHYVLPGGRAYKKKDCWRFFTVDLAVSEKTSADFFALGVWVVTPESDLLLWDVCREHLSGPDQAPLVESMCARHRPMFVGVESTAYQLALVQDLCRRGLPAKEIPADRDKVARAQIAAVRMAAGRIMLRQNAPWLQAIEDELLAFPNGRHDDLVDMTSMAANEVAAYVMPTIS